MPNWVLTFVSFLSPCPLAHPGLFLPAPTEEQQKIIKKLGDENFSVRESAQEELEKRDSEIYKALLQAATTTDNLEIRYRCLDIMKIVMRYNQNNKLPTLFGAYGLEVKFKSGRVFSITKEDFLRHYQSVINNSEDSWRASKNLHQFTYLLPTASHYMFKEMRLYGYSRADIDELIDAMNTNFKKMNDNRKYLYYQWLN